MENNDVTLIAFNEILKEIEKTNRKLRRAKMINRLYFVFACSLALALHDRSREEIKKLKRKSEENE